MTSDKLLSKKVLFVTGKGGVGKSTLSSAIAYHLAGLGEKVLAIDADPAHSLPDTFGITSRVYGKSQKFLSNGKLVKVYDNTNLDFLLLNPVTTREQYKGHHKIMWLAELGKELGFYSNLSRMSEFFTLANTLYQSFGKYDHFVIDNEPSAGTLDMIDNIDGWINGLDNIKKYKLIFNMILKAGIKDKQIVQQTKEIMYGQNGTIAEEYKQMLSSVKQLFTNQKYLEPIIVSSPEDTVIRETHRLRKELEDRVGIQNRYVIFNKVSINPDTGKIQKEKIRSFRKETKTDCFSVPQLSISEINLHDELGAIDMLRSLYAQLKKCSP